MGKIYNIVLNSQFGTIPTAGDSRLINFFYDWSLLQQGRYKLTFQFVSSVFTTGNTTVGNLYTDLCQTNTFFAQPTDGTVNTNTYAYQYLGMIRASGTGASNYLYAPNNFNGEMYLEQRPQNNLFSILILNNDATRSFYTSATINFNYSLILNLELLD